MKESEVARLWKKVAGGLGVVGISPLGLVLAAALGISGLFIKNDYILRLLTISLLQGSQAVALDFTTGFIGVVNFGFAGFAGLGAYTSALLATRLGISPFIGLLAGGVAAGLLGLATGLLTLRLRGLFAAFMTWFLSLTLMSLITVNVGLTRGAKGLIVPPLFEGTNTRGYFYIALIAAVIGYIVMARVANSHIGLAFRAIGQNLDVARASGIDPTKYKVLNFSLSCTFAGVLGAILGHYVGILTPSVLSSDSTLVILTLSYVGGRGSLWGGLLAAFLFVPAFQGLQHLMAWRLVIYGLVLILSMLFLPDGLADIYRRTMGRVLRSWVARKGHTPGLK